MFSVMRQGLGDYLKSARRGVIARSLRRRSNLFFAQRLLRSVRNDSLPWFFRQPLRAAIVILSFAPVCLLGSCGTTMIKKEAPVMEQNLVWAGFLKVTADSSEKLEKLLVLPPYKIVKRKVNGQIAYIYADPTNCKCAYIGNPEQYAAFQQLMATRSENEATALNTRMEAQEQEEAIMDSWDPL